VPELTPAELSIWNALLASIADEMGVVLGLAAHSPNIRERRDYSAAVFDAAGEMVAQAAHIPVHLGAMPEAVAAVQKLAPWRPGDVAIVNDPYLGGTHLPDVSLVSPVFHRGQLAGFASNRAHHADIGGMSAGSMPNSTELFQEGVIIPPLRFMDGGVRNEALYELILRNVRTPEERRGDFDAQLAAIRVGVDRYGALLNRYGASTVRTATEELKAYAERLARAAIEALPDGLYAARDTLDPGYGEGTPPVVAVTVRIAGDTAEVDFTGSSPHLDASVNAVAAVTKSAVAYCLRCLMPAHAPSNSGYFRPLRFILPERSIVNPEPQHAVSAGNVETSQRITDVVLAALQQAAPERIPAASAGTMSNFTYGGTRADGTPFASYETIPGGAGAGPGGPGESGIQTHMTNTANTPVEALERTHPIRVWRFELREGSGGDGVHDGGEGVVKEVEFLAPASVSIVGDRRHTGPPGAAGGGAGSPAADFQFDAAGGGAPLPGPAQVRVRPGGRIRIETPGGGGWGKPDGSRAG
jgi:N-methylhydantoinase B